MDFFKNRKLNKRKHRKQSICVENHRKSMENKIKQEKSVEKLKKLLTKSLLSLGRLALGALCLLFANCGIEDFALSCSPVRRLGECQIGACRACYPASPFLLFCSQVEIL